MPVLRVFEMRVMIPQTVVVAGGRKSECFRPCSPVARARLFATRRVVQDLVAWKALSYGAHGWQTVERFGSGELKAEVVVRRVLVL